MMGTLHTPGAPASDLGKQAPTRRHDRRTPVCRKKKNTHKSTDKQTERVSERSYTVGRADVIPFVSINPDTK